MPIKTFRGKIVKGNSDTIVLHTNNGSTGYRIVKFQVMGTSEDENYESTIQVWSVPTTAVLGVDFSNQELLAAILYGDSNATGTTSSQTIIFENMVFNQDIYVTFESAAASADINYYLELEQVKLDLNESTVATLKDLRNVT
tara:strand:- start:20 stop:445 length:426 start_codon:yes stop_codon:yes gene_type:complete